MMTEPTVRRVLRPLLTLACVLVAIGATVDAYAGTPAPGTAEHEKFERDREAILAMAGEYRVNFQFMETVPLRPGYEPKAPYLADATEFVEVVEDAGDRIVLQHILVLDGEGESADAESRVVKHWRQDWHYENRMLYEFAGHRTWKPRTLSADEAEGTWTQRVFQVDDSPRYQGFGRWVHAGNLSSWESNETWRPLPRREYTKRSDYDVLVAVNRHTITPAGWFHEQDNYKLVLPESGEAVSDPILVREAGLNEYVRVSDIDFTAGRDYWRDTQAYWSDVRAAWEELFASGEPIRLRAKVDDRRLHQHMFDQAKAVDEAGAYDPAAGRKLIRATLTKFLVTDAATDTTAAY